MSATLLTLKETAMRIGELCSVKWTNINVEKCTITCNQPEKNSNPRIFKVSTKLIGMIQALPHDCEKVFGASTKTSKEWNSIYRRNDLQKNLNNPRLKEIKFHTFRHWKATMEYHETRDPWHVKKFLGHKKLQNTELYIHIEETIFNAQSSEYHLKVAETAKEACELLEVGFEYVTEMEGKKLFRKRK